MLQWTWGCGYFFELVFLFLSFTYSEVGLMDYMIVLFSTFWHTSILFSIVAAPISFPPTLHKGFLFFTFYQHLLGFPGGLVIKNLPVNARRHRRCRFYPWVRKIPWRRKWQPTPVFLPGKSHGQRSMAGYSLWCHRESDMTERLTHTYMYTC